ncbi:MAG: hypothetical protein WBW85_07020 [Terriglobales bacterium]
MFNSITLDVVIGLVFVYLLLAIMCSTINEWFAGLLKTRASNLSTALKQLLDNQPASSSGVTTFLQQFYKHPLISGMQLPGKTTPEQLTERAHFAYLSARTFATTIMDLATPQKKGTITYQDLQQGLVAMPDGDVRTALLALIQNANGDLAKAQKNIENWFDDSMDRASGWYKRQAALITVVIAVFLTVLSNADTIAIVRTLWKNPTDRALLVQKAQNRVGEDLQPTVSVTYANKDNPLQPTAIRKVTTDEAKALGDVLGWKRDAPRLSELGWLQHLFGWFLTAVAVSLGAPFWFDILNKLINIRNAGKKPPTSDEDSQTNGSSKPQTAAQGAANA